MKWIALLQALLVFCRAESQDTLTFRQLNERRIAASYGGMKVLSGWGALNLAGGITGAVLAKTEEGRAFHTMNALWGGVNLGIGLIGAFGAQRETRQRYDAALSYGRYESTKRLFLVNAGLDAVYLGTGLYLREHSKVVGKHPAQLRGYGNAILLQGAFLLLFDGTMYGLHQRRDKKWYRLLEGLSLGKGSVGFRYGL